MNIFEPINKYFLENKKIDITFSKLINKKEKDFLKFIFKKYNLMTILEKSSIVDNLSLYDILKELKYKDVSQLQKFLNNLLSKKINFNIYSDKKLVVSGSFPIFSSYSIVYDKINFTFTREVYLGRKPNTLFGPQPARGHARVRADPRRRAYADRSCGSGRRISGGPGRTRRQGQRALQVLDHARTPFRAARRTRRGAQSAPRTQDPCGRGDHRTAQCGQVHLHFPHFGGPAQDCGLSLHHADAQPRRRDRRVRSRSAYGGGGHPRPHRRRQ